MSKVPELIVVLLEKREGLVTEIIISSTKTTKDKS